MPIFLYVEPIIIKEENDFSSTCISNYNLDTDIERRYRNKM